MASADLKNVPALGYLTVVEHDQMGLFGGFLLLNFAVRPLEFHCTAPIKPNRAQQILYGPTLEPYIYGEQIGQTLVQKSALSPAVIFTDRREMLVLRDHIEQPVVLVLDEQVDSNEHNDLLRFTIGKNHVAISNSCEVDRTTIEERLSELAESIDLTEPFGRIRGAIEEAQRASRAA
jgi:hypothetical protein